MNNKIEDILNGRAVSPTPMLQADPFLATRIAAIAKKSKGKNKNFTLLYNWSVASVVTSCAIILGVYLGSALFEEESNTDVISDLSGAIYQVDYIDNLDSVLEEGGTEK